MTDWPKMESMVMVSDGYFASEAFRSLPECIKKDALEHLQGVPSKIIGLTLYDNNAKSCGVLVGKMVFDVPIEYVEYLVADIFEKDNKPTSEEIKPVKAVEEKAGIVSFPFTDDSRTDDVLLFFARNGYKTWVEDFSYLRGGKLKVERPKGRT